MTLGRPAHFGVVVVNRRDAIKRVAAVSATLALPAWAQSGRIVLGQSAALSGPAAQLGIQMNRGAKIFFDQLNASGGVNGHTVELRGAEGPRAVRLRGKADRIDLLQDGTFRVIDYKLGRAPKNIRALQLPVYSACAEQELRRNGGYRGRQWTVSAAGYVAFKEKNPFVALGASSSLQQALDEGTARFIAAVDSIERGEFPVRPEEPFMCTRCGYSGVCRKDYIGDE